MMASRRGPSQAREYEQIMRARQAEELVAIQAKVERNHAIIAAQKRMREEAAQVAEAAKAARKSAKIPTPPPTRRAPVTPKEPSYLSRDVTPHPSDRTATPSEEVNH